jgi:hypothetical protein
MVPSIRPVKVHVAGFGEAVLGERRDAAAGPEGVEVETKAAQMVTKASNVVPAARAVEETVEVEVEADGMNLPA